MIPLDQRIAGAESVPPEVTIAIPVYNGARYIEDAVRSALAQEGVDFEVLVVDNASTDDTVERVIAMSHPRLRLIRNDENVGMTRNFNRCLEMARGHFIKFLCADDMLDRDCTVRLIDVMRQHPDVALASSARRLVDVHGHPVGFVRHAKRTTFISSLEALRLIFHVRNVAGEPTAVLFRREDARRGFDPAFSQALDVEMWFHLLSFGRLAILPEALCSIRVHEEQGTRANLRSGRLVEDKRRLFRTYSGRARPGASLWRRFLWDLRMISSIYRSGPETLRRIRQEGIREVYSPRLLAIALPLVSLVKRSKA